MNSKRKYVIGFSIVVLAVAYLAWSMFTAQYKFVIGPTEFLEAGHKNTGEAFKLSGMVKEGTISSSGGDLRFSISDEKNSINVHYIGMVPNNFREGGDIVVTGIFDEKAKIFEATEMLTKCASKYSAK